MLNKFAHIVKPLLRHDKKSVLANHKCQNKTKNSQSLLNHNTKNKKICIDNTSCKGPTTLILSIQVLHKHEGNLDHEQNETDHKSIIM